MLLLYKIIIITSENVTARATMWKYVFNGLEMSSRPIIWTYIYIYILCVSTTLEKSALFEKDGEKISRNTVTYKAYRVSNKDVICICILFAVPLRAGVLVVIKTFRFRIRVFWVLATDAIYKREKVFHEVFHELYISCKP